MTKEAYRAAYEEAKLDLADTLREFEQLRLRKEQFEKLIETLKPLVEQAIGADPKSASEFSRYPWSGR
jgi:hypothetical protein